jgi:3-hydroxyisobutyrate dehydrogenase-like beta-hydroxyacid dehydrogenase
MATKPDDEKQVAVIGLGNMGRALAERLLGTGYKVSVWNRTDTKCLPLVELGATSVSTPAKAASLSDTILICVIDLDAVESILASDGMAEALAGKTVVQLSALEPDQSRNQNEWMRKHHVRYLDGGIISFPTEVREGNAMMVYSGPKEAFEDQKSILESFGDDCIFIGEHAGMAPLAAMLVYTQYYGITFTCIHTAALAAAAGIPGSKLLELTGGGKAWQSRGEVMDDYVAMTEKGDYSTTEATLEVDFSGYNFFARLSRELGVDPAFHEMIESVLSKAIEQGRGDQAIPAIFETLRGNSST